MADAKRIAKNTMFMYIRMILIMAVSIFTSRVVLDKLGVNDYGLYNAVASVVAVMTFLNQTLSTSTSRFLNYDLGQGDQEKLRETFSTAFFSHVFLAGMIVVAMETVGLWYIATKFVIPEGREWATHLVFQLSILNTSILVVQVPYTASIIAHENMNVYAYVGIIEVLAQLGIVYLLSISPIDKLVFYAALLVSVRVVVFLLFGGICRHCYSETLVRARFNRKTFQRMLGFTGWTAVANVSNSFIVQGAVLLLNLFFAPVVIAAQALASQVSHAIMHFVNNFRVAMNPQIIKSYAAGDFDESKRLTLTSTIIAFDLMLVIGLPFICTMDTVFRLWLVDVPEYAVSFTRFAVFSQIIHTVATSTYVPFVASGRLKKNAIWGLVAGISYFVLLYFIFALGGDAMWTQYAFLLLVLVSSLVIRPLLLHLELGYQWRDLLSCYWQCCKVFIFALAVAYVLSVCFDKSLWQQVVLFLSVLITSLISVIVFMEKRMRRYVLNLIKSRFKF